MQGTSDAGAAEGKPRIKIGTALFAQPASHVAVPVQVDAAERLPRHSFVRVRGLPPSVSLTEGFAIGPGMWAVPLLGLATLKANVPAGASGQWDFLVALVDAEGTILAEAASKLVIGPEGAHAPADEEPGGVGRIENKALGYRPAGNDPTAPRLAKLSADERAGAEKRLARGVSHLAHGNIGAAREFFRHAAEAGLAVAARLLAATYDPVELQRMRAVGVVADQEEARKWYERARELGALDVPSRATDCKC
jgi:TPR repeat protein